MTTPPIHHDLALALKQIIENPLKKPLSTETPHEAAIDCIVSLFSLIQKCYKGTHPPSRYKDYIAAYKTAFKLLKDTYSDLNETEKEEDGGIAQCFFDRLAMAPFDRRRLKTYHEALWYCAERGVNGFDVVAAFPPSFKYNARAAIINFYKTDCNKAGSPSASPASPASSLGKRHAAEYDMESIENPERRDVVMEEPLEPVSTGAAPVDVNKVVGKEVIVIDDEEEENIVKKKVIRKKSSYKDDIKTVLDAEGGGDLVKMETAAERVVNILLPIFGHESVEEFVLWLDAEIPKNNALASTPVLCRLHSILTIKMLVKRSAELENQRIKLMEKIKQVRK